MTLITLASEGSVLFLGESLRCFCLSFEDLQSFNECLSLNILQGSGAGLSAVVGGRDAALGETVGSSDPQQEPKCPLRGGVGGQRKLLPPPELGSR